MPVQDIASVFSEEGPLARAPGYRRRHAQVELAQAVADTISSGQTLVAEAGTGIGKTWAYLVPALMAGGKVLISTGTRTLQDQLFHRDLPQVRDALAVPVTTALLKGRSNYLCLYHMDRLSDEGQVQLRSRTEVSQLRVIERFARITQSGDRGELEDIPEQADIWQRVTSTRENCLGQECPRIRDCFVMKARRQAQEAEVVVINHSLFLADLALREDGVTDLLPEVQTVVFDEAHQLPETATRFLGSSVSTYQVMDFCRDAQAAGLAQAREALNWTQAGASVEQAAREFRLACAGVERLPGRRATPETIPELPAFTQALGTLIEAVSGLTDQLNEVAEKHPDLAAATRQGEVLVKRLRHWRQGALGVAEALPIGDKTVHWVEQGAHHIRLLQAPLSVAESFSRHRPGGQAWVLLSATLSVQGDFSHFLGQLGLAKARTAQWVSPFDYGQQALLFVPKHLPLPQSPEFLPQLAQTVMPMLQASPGGSLILCTTLRAVERMAELLREACEDQDLAWPILQQGEAPRQALLKRFREAEHPVLVGSASFWEGIDLPGDLLTLVVIDKLPFAPPDDPVTQARLDQCRRSGGRPFEEYQLPQAAIALKQGAGRLIRSERDWGVLMVADARLVDKAYGKRLWRGLPPFARTRELQAVLDFYAARAKAPAMDT